MSETTRFCRYLFYAPTVFMSLALACAAGLVGGVALLVIESLLPQVSRMEIDLVRAVADLLVPDRFAVLFTYATPLVMGGVFGGIYAGLWQHGIGAPTWAWAAIFGVVHGLLIIGASPLIRWLRPGLFDLPHSAVWMAGEVFDHVAYALVTAGVYRLLVG